VDPYNVEAVLGDLGEISLYHLTSKALFPVLVYLEGAIADASNPELFLTNKEKLPPYSRALRDEIPLRRCFQYYLHCIHNLGLVRTPRDSASCVDLIWLGCSGLFFR